MPAIIKSEEVIYVKEKKCIEERVSLKKLNSKDLDNFYLWASDPEVAANMNWPISITRSETEKFLKEVADNHPWFKTICLDGKPVGTLSLNPGKGNSACRAEIGYVLAKEYWGQGITTEALKQALQQGFRELKIKRIEAFVDPDNKASQKVLLKAGFECEGLLKNYTLFKGTLRDRYIFSITK